MRISRRQGIIATILLCVDALAKLTVAKPFGDNTIIGNFPETISLNLFAYKSYVFYLGKRSITLSAEDIMDALESLK